MLSFTARALGLSLVEQSTARVAHDTRPDIEQRDANNGVVDWFNRLFRKEVDDTIQARQATCAEDSYYNFVHNSSFGEDFCRSFIDYPEITVTGDYTPVSTTTYVYTTMVGTRKTTVSPVTTATVTVGMAKREAAPEPTPMARHVSNAQIADFLNAFRRQNAANSTSVSDAAMSASFSRACDCQTYAA